MKGETKNASVSFAGLVTPQKTLEDARVLNTTLETNIHYITDGTLPKSRALGEVACRLHGDY